MGSIFGGSKSKSQQSAQATNESWNEAYPQLSQSFMPQVQTGVASNNAMADLLGIGGDPSAQQAAFDRWKGSTGYQFMFDEGQKAITNNNALKGLLNSGATMKALQDRGQALASTKYNDYLSQLLSVSNAGTQAGSIVSGAGQRSTGQSTSQGTSSSKQKNGIGPTLAAAASLAAASDRRLKTNIVEVGQFENGLKVYEYEYVTVPDDSKIKRFMINQGRHRGVMADEVREIIPEALGPVIDGYATVDYSKIGVL